MRLVVVSHKPCWESPKSPSGYATDGGFPFQMRALSELFDETKVLVPCLHSRRRAGESPLTGYHLSVLPLSLPSGRGFWRKAGLPFWFFRNGPLVLRALLRADAIHTPIPGDIGTIGMLAAFVLRKPLFVRHCGNWLVQETIAERFWKWFMERFAGGKRIMLATGGDSVPPSGHNSTIRWIFSTSLTERELRRCFTFHDAPNHGQARLIIACRQEKTKGTGVVIESMPLILKDFPKATLDVVGDGEALAEFRTLARALGVGDQVYFHGKVDHSTVMSLLKQSDLLCYPTSASEGFPKIVHEALACGLPVVTTRVSVLPKLVSTGCGLLIDEATPTFIAKAVRECLSNADAYRTMSSLAMETARGYSLERWRDMIGEMLRVAWGPLSSGD